MVEWHDTVIVGGGQSGLAMSYHLRQKGRQHVILERARVADRWRSERWDSLRFQFPNRYLRLPGLGYQGSEPEGFASGAEVARFVEDYSRRIEAPVRCGVEVVSLDQKATRGRFRIATRDELLEATNVVVATGPFQAPLIPALAQGLSSRVLQIHAATYRNPAQLPPGGVLLVGSGASGSQIAEELMEHGRRVYLSVGRHRRLPRRYRGRDVLDWLDAMGSLDTTIDTFPGGRYPPPMLVTGARGGHDVDLRTLADAGLVLLGTLRSADGESVEFDDNAESLVSHGEDAYFEFVAAVNEFVRQAGIEAPCEPKSRARSSGALQLQTALDLRQAGVSTVIWCTGYRLAFDWIKAPAFDPRGAPVQERGVTGCPGLYFLGLHWMHTIKSGTIFGVGADAAYLAGRICN